MSAFMISTETMHRVVFAIDKAAYEHSWHGIPVATCGQLDALGAKLFAMNARAVDARYLDGPRAAVPPYRYRPLGDEITVPATARFKAVACLLYQCMEGSEPESDLFKALESLRTSLAVALAHKAAEKEPWDWPDRD